MPTMHFRKIGKASLKLNHKALDAAVNQTLKDFQKIAIAAHEETTENWKHDVKFHARRMDFPGKSGQEGVAVKVWTDDVVWGYVDEGTKPHDIRPKKPGGVLAFPSAFAPKTQPRSLKSGAGSSGGPVVVTQAVHHPGTKARNFSAMLQRKLDNIYGVMINAVFTKFGPHIFG